MFIGIVGIVLEDSHLSEVNNQLANGCVSARHDYHFLVNPDWLMGSMNWLARQCLKWVEATNQDVYNNMCKSIKLHACVIKSEHASWSPSWVAYRCAGLKKNLFEVRGSSRGTLMWQKKHVYLTLFWFSGKTMVESLTVFHDNLWFWWYLIIFDDIWLVEWVQRETCKTQSLCVNKCWCYSIY